MEIKNITEEIWKPVEGLEDYYEVSNTGKVRSKDRVVILKGARRGEKRTYSGKEIHPLKSKDHMYVKLHKGGFYISISVGKLVAQHFLDGFKESGRYSVNYKDGNPYNCAVDNLDYSRR